MGKRRSTTHMPCMRDGIDMMYLGTRRPQKIGVESLNITLPAAWVQSHSYSKMVELHCFVDIDGNLVLKVPEDEPEEEIERLRAIIASFAGCGKTRDCTNLGSDDCIDDCGHAAEHYKGGDE